MVLILRFSPIIKTDVGNIKNEGKIYTFEA